MKRYKTLPRHQCRKKVEELGFIFHTPDMPYWDESIYYTFNYAQIDVLEKATATLYDLCLKAAEYVIENKLYAKLLIPDSFVSLIERSWQNEDPSIYGRFDLWYDGVNPPKLYEFNADTPTSLFEASIVQWFWLKEYKAEADQFNSMHEKIIDYWKYVKPYLKQGKLYFACARGSSEDFVTTEYLRDCAIQAELDTEFLYMDEIGWHNPRQCFTDLNEQPICNIFKLYPYEWMWEEDFYPYLIQDTMQAYWIEPPWRIIWSCKGILPILWELFPEHENLLPAYFEANKFGSKEYVRKPIYAREGANVGVIKNGRIIMENAGEYGHNGYVYQAYQPLPNFSGNYPVIGSWVIGQEPAGMGIRESDTVITTNTSRFIPHYIEV